MNSLVLLLIVPAVFAAYSHVGFIRFNEPVPEFLNEMSLKAQYDYKIILENDTISIDTKNLEFKKWAATYNVTTQFSSYQTLQNSSKLQFDKNVTQLISQLSNVNSQIKSILENGSLSAEEQKSAVEELGEEELGKEVSVILFIRHLLNPKDVLSKKNN